MIRTLVHYTSQALLNLMATKLRTFLAVLGILVGTASIVALVSCSQLATEKALEQFRVLGTNLIAVSVFSQETEPEAISLKFWRNLPTLIPEIVRVSPYSTVFQPISFQGIALNPAVKTIIGADETLAQNIHIHLQEGYFISYMQTIERFCVIGHTLAQQLQHISADNLLGKQLRIGSFFFTIVGITSKWEENGFFTEDINQAIIIPINGLTLFNKNNKINNTIVLLHSDEKIDEVISQIQQFIHIQNPNIGSFAHSAKQVINSMKNQSQIFTFLLAVIGGISLLVGGIGVMNVMLNSISERKKEIGIRKAVGAKDQEIQSLFLVESVILTLLGGLMGAFCGLVLTWIIAYFSHWTFTIYIFPLLIGFGVSVITGIFFGFYPARRASKLEAIESLRS